MRTIIFATGIECSYPTVQGGKRRDELESTKHYEHWREDFQLCKDVGATCIRYGPPYYRMHKGPQQYDWSFTDEVLPVMRDMGLIPILDLCHFGVPDWAGNFQNTEWPELFAEYAEAFCKRYPWIQYYTPVNEMLVCARFSAKNGWWNEQLKSDQALVMALQNMCRAQILAVERILKLNTDVVFFQSETAEIHLERHPETRDEVQFRNQFRFVTFDLIYGQAPGAAVYSYLMDNGLSPETYRWFMEHGRDARLHCVMGMDYYAMNERVVSPDDSEQPVGPCVGWATIAQEYFERYRKPIMLTETNNLGADGGPEWLWRVWNNMELARRKGIPIVGYTWFSLTDQVDWDIQLREIRGKVNANGLYTLDRTPRPAASAFRDLCHRYGNLPLVEDFAMGSIEGTRPIHQVVQNPI